MGGQCESCLRRLIASIRLFAKKIAFFEKKRANNLVNSKKSSTFAPAFEKKATFVSTMTNGIKAITSDFGSENLGSIPGWSTQGARLTGFF